MADEGAVRFGIIGCAGIARKMSRAISLAPNATLVASASRSLSKAEAFRSSNGLEDSVRSYGEYESVLNDPSVDAVYIPLPTSLHVKWAVAAAEKKKHVLLEKPTAINVAELDVIIKACEVNGVQFMDGTMFMQHPLPSEQVVRTEMPQEARMVEEFSKLVAGVKREHRLPEMKWAAIARKTQLVVDAVKTSIENDFRPVDIQG